MSSDTAIELLREIVPPEGLLKERDDFDAEGWLLRARAYVDAQAAPADGRSDGQCSHPFSRVEFSVAVGYQPQTPLPAIGLFCRACNTRLAIVADGAVHFDVEDAIAESQRAALNATPSTGDALDDALRALNDLMAWSERDGAPRGAGPVTDSVLAQAAAVLMKHGVERKTWAALRYAARAALSESTKEGN